MQGGAVFDGWQLADKMNAIAFPAMLQGMICHEMLHVFLLLLIELAGACAKGACSGKSCFESLADKLRTIGYFFEALGEPLVSLERDNRILFFHEIIPLQKIQSPARWY